MKQMLLLLFTVTFYGQAQTKGIVVDSVSGEPVSYANIWIENGSIGATSEEDGHFTIVVPDDKKLVFSAMGYDTKTVNATELGVVKLAPAVFTLDEVVVAKPLRKKELEIGNSKKLYHTHLSGATPWIYAKYFKYEDLYAQTPFIKNAIVFTDSEIKNATFKLRIYEVKDDGFPGMDLVNEDIVIAVKKGWEKNIIDLSKYNLMMPRNGIFIAYEWLIIESNKYIFKYKDKSLANPRQEFVTYAPVVVCNPVDVENTYRYSGGKWSQSKKVAYDGKYSNLVIEPAINLTLSN